ncbi:MAG: acetoacetate--CoA ligase [Saprospiraceae bacterium]|nr:acetoacetate--CoA ligase [Saprospiraceae bacterium]
MNQSDIAKKLWQPTLEIINDANISDYQSWLGEHYHLFFDDYKSLHQWSVENIELFWETIYKYFGVIGHAPYQSVTNNLIMPKTNWFEGATLNYAEHIFRAYKEHQNAILFQSERQQLTSISWKTLYSEVASLQFFLKSAGVKKGDRIAAYIPNIPEASVALFASMSIGAIWSSCSPDFGSDSVVDRFAQIEPKILIAVDGYSYGGKPFDKVSVVKEICEKLPTVELVIFIPYLNEDAQLEIENKDVVLWQDVISEENNQIIFEPLPFSHPIWILYSSGTTGKPKAITHSHGGVLLEHYKYLAFHNDVKPDEIFFWFTTTGWMMWNFLHASMLMGSTIVLYEGSPGYPNMNVLWELAENAKINHFGTSAPYLMACKKANVQPNKLDLSNLRSIGSTGSPLTTEGFDYVYEQIKSDVWLSSMSGGSDVCTAFVGGNPLLPVYEGEIQCVTLGCSLEAWNDNNQKLLDEVGEMVITKPMPSMPIYFWNDPDGTKYFNSYFDYFEGVWRHGDWVKITNRDSLIISGRSDATLNRQGVRIGTAEIYSALDKLEQIKDSLIVNIEKSDGSDFMPLFVMMQPTFSLTDDLKQTINKILKSTYSPRHVPDEIIVVNDIPFTISGKKMETAVKKILMGSTIEKAATLGSMRNPESLEEYVKIKNKRDSNK